MLTAGSRLGPYEVISALGAGGMGEVWRARDTRLGRDIAIKVLRPDPQFQALLTRCNAKPRLALTSARARSMALLGVGLNDAS